ncbi:transcriptional regulator, TetR family [Thermobaculum terrenum ATCC BAA-798]|uniref:Transcriptional regulator, TetR family n=1 Tax=Thermobaculum terrenum (strain ATCC BAA-798 / CCMEE 7001 / YNP1) TaxID=525904 RepID=D1CI95_THET1|nr:TetR/AcrR family transcriptional regulator [Thermobaculum terrenum]ACZ43466.1 transcriptional regulator, TetR family [Thermobaculum terrenum ATCC BAA-798]
MEGEDRRQQILRAAFEEFSEKGFHGATIKGIAERASLQSPALIYWYFPGGKEELFASAVESQLSFLQSFRDPEALLDLPPDALLRKVADAYGEFVSRPVTIRLARLLLGEAPRHPKLFDPVVARGPMRVLRFLETYLERQVQLGRLRPHDVRASARAFLGMLFPMGLSHVLLPQLREHGPTDEEYVATMIETFLDGLRPHPQEAGDDGD